MKNLVSLITIVMCMMCSTLSAQVLLNDSTIENVKQSTGKDVTAEQLALLLGDEMPSGEIECNEYYENEYFGDGWPKELFYQKNITQGENTKIELKTISWLRRSVRNQ